MRRPEIRSILVPTDFSDEAAIAFAHALRLAIAFKAELDVFHVEPKNDQSDWHWAPSVLNTLKRWKILPADATPDDLDRLGIRARRSVAAGVKADAAILQELANAHADLVVMATHGRSGLERWVQPSVASPVAIKGSAPVLLIPPNCAGFIDGQSGAGSLERVLVPVDHRPHPAPGYDAAELFIRTLPGDEIQLATYHVGAKHPEIDLLHADPAWRVHHWTQDGVNVIDSVLETAQTWNADLIVAVTEGRLNFLDNLRGSTVDRLLHRAKTPVLVVPADWGEIPQQA